jgi:hypothetical protein
MTSLLISDEVEQLKIDIDSDDGLKVKRKYVFGASFMLVILGVLGGKVTEVNIGIAKFESLNLKALEFFLIFWVFACLIRYYGYAKNHQRKIKNILHMRLLKDPYFLKVCQYSDEASGLIYDYAPSDFYSLEIGCNNNGYSESTYISRFPMCREISYIWSIDGIFEPDAKVVNIWLDIGKREYIKVIFLELKYKFFRFLDREYLDIYGAYIFSIVALMAYVFRDFISAFIN